MTDIVRRAEHQETIVTQRGRRMIDTRTTDSQRADGPADHGQVSESVSATSPQSPPYDGDPEGINSGSLEYRKCSGRSGRRLRRPARSLITLTMLLNVAVLAGSPLTSVFGVQAAGSSGRPASWGSRIHIDSSSNNLAAISCPTAYFCATVDGQGNASKFNGKLWTAYHNVDSSSRGFATVSCGSPESCWAVDDEGFFTHFNGRGWSAMESEDPSRSGGYSDVHPNVSCPTAGFCAGVDINGAVLTWRNGRWSRRFIQNVDTFESIGCGSAMFCVAGEHNGDVVTWNGATWSTAHATTTGDGISSLSCWSDRICVAGTDFGEVELWNGKQWTPAQQVATNGVAIVGTACFGIRSCLAVDGYGQVFVWQGSSWREAAAVDPNSTPGLLPDGATGVSCASGTFCAAINAASTGGYVYFRAIAPMVTTSSLPSGVKGYSYHAPLRARYGPSPYRWRIADGGLPRGLQLGKSGTIRGKPTQTGTFRFTVTVTDPLAQSGTRELTLKVAK